ncbi:hypothetical protein LL037_21215 [Clostridium estertheticum]|uniref:N-terminal phage integrase SAM-like domain-containing protein n=1 Tax=Clostridium estertheticum TaxID=238834 RepID=UPI00209A765C|nr:N-terminal phage integrase SAM-like domain-containing protein [Clostridium estertheticum]WAG68101.1 hypothetical protein LL037_21215 [Clostridium estertheticum]
MKVKDFLNTWLETYAKNLSPTTYNGYKIIVNNHLNPAFGELEIQKLQPIHLQQYYNAKSETLKGKTLIQHHRVFRKALDYAYCFNSRWYSRSFFICIQLQIDNHFPCIIFYNQ